MIKIQTTLPKEKKKGKSKSGKKAKITVLLVLGFLLLLPTVLFSIEGF